MGGYNGCMSQEMPSLETIKAKYIKPEDSELSKHLMHLRGEQFDSAYLHWVESSNRKGIPESKDSNSSPKT